MVGYDPAQRISFLIATLSFHAAAVTQHLRTAKVHTHHQQSQTPEATVPISWKDFSPEWLRASAMRHAKPENPNSTRVCISLAAYEEPWWIDAVLENAQKFLEPNTTIMLHLNSEAEYSEAQIAQWNKSFHRVFVTPERVAAQRFHGSILYSHLMNVKYLPSNCHYVLLQASNMLWMRRGVEDAVRDQHMGGVNNITCKCQGECMCRKRMLHDFFRNWLVSMGGPINETAPAMGWGYHEGAFYPVTLVKEFAEYLDKYLDNPHRTLDVEVLNAMDDAEEYWLQTYALNRIPWKEEYGPALALFETTEVGVSLESAKSIQKGEKPPPPFWNDKLFGKHGFFAAKRIMRDLQNPVTSYIMSLP